MLKISDESILKQIKSQDDQGVIHLYKSYRNEFILWAKKKFDIGEDQAADVFQDCIITFRSNVISGKLTVLSSSIKTYLFGIGKNLILSKFRKSSKEVYDETMLNFFPSVEPTMEQTIEHNEKQKMIRTWLSNLGEPCYTVLRLFYYEGFSMEAIAAKMGYKNDNVAKTQKLRCINSLKSKLIKASNKENVN